MAGSQVPGFQDANPPHYMATPAANSSTLVPLEKFYL